jgi:hypothetical protein
VGLPQREEEINGDIWKRIWRTQCSNQRAKSASSSVGSDEIRICERECRTEQANGPSEEGDGTSLKKGKSCLWLTYQKEMTSEWCMTDPSLD